MERQYCSHVWTNNKEQLKLFSNIIFIDDFKSDEFELYLELKKKKLDEFLKKQI